MENRNPETDAKRNEKAGADEEEKRLAAMSVEETFEALDAMIDRLERGEGSLEDAFKNYEQGMKLVKSCNDKIDAIEKQVMVLSGDKTEEEEDVVYF